MRPGPTFVQLAVCLSSLASITGGHQLDTDSGLVIRQNNNNDETPSANDEPSITEPPTSSPTGSPGRQSNTDEDSPSSTGGNNNNDDDRNTSGSGSGTRPSRPTRTRFNPNVGTGGVSMITPVTTIEPTPLYKISDYVTFSWNFTSVRGTPSGVDLLISCQAASKTWTLSSNMSYATDIAYTWDTNDQANDPQDPLLQELYTLIIKDSEAEITDVPSAGYLGAYTGLTFGLYQGAQATSYRDWLAANPQFANAATKPGSHATTVALAVTMATMAGFTWFTVGLGLF